MMRVNDGRSARPMSTWRITMVVLMIVLGLPAFPHTNSAGILPDAPAAYAQTDEVCQAPEPTAPPLETATITLNRRQPFADTLDIPPVVSFNPTLDAIVLSSGRATLRTLKTALTASYTGTEKLLTEDSPKVWLLRKNLIIERAAALTVSDATATWLRIASTAAITPPLSVKTYGYLQFNKSKVTSWDTTKDAVDKAYADGRAYLIAYQGGRMDFVSSEAAYLGYKDGEASGIAWRKCFNPADHTTGATGDIFDSNIHHNFFGMYSYQANAIWAKNNQMHDNVQYGFDPHDFSDNFIFENNTVTNNGKHGIIFSRSCDFNIIRNNTVTGSFHHGIMLDRRSNFNQVFGNTVKNNDDGIAIFQSQNNSIKGNTVSNNLTGIRINATPVPPKNGVPDRTLDLKALFNTITGNTITTNTNYGIYLYNRADNTTISGNTITGNGRNDGVPSTSYGSGIHIKTGGNTIGPNNIITNNGHGVSLLAIDSTSDPVGDGDTPDQQPAPQPNVEAGLPGGAQNTVLNNTIAGSKGRGLRMVGANQNTIKSNDIGTSGDEGVYSDGGSDNVFDSNTIHDNGTPSGTTDEGVKDLGNYGITIKGVTAHGNKLTHNSITRNGRAAIKLGSGTNLNLSSPTLTQPTSTSVIGLAGPNNVVEVFHDLTDEAETFIGTTTADASGNWQLTVPAVNGGNYAATQTDASNNTSQLSHSITAFGVAVAPGRKAEQTIYVSGTETEVSLFEVRDKLITLGKGNLLTDDGTVDGKRTWTLNASLFISPTVTLNVQGGTTVADAQRVQWLRLFSDPDPTFDPTKPLPDPPVYNPNLFATIKAYNGNLLFEDTKVTSWDRTTNKTDVIEGDGRAFVLAKYEAEMDIIRSDMSYLGYLDGEAYGVAWRDVNSSADPPEAPRRTRVTGQIIDSIFSHNHYGIYTFQARDMTFRNNKMFSNSQYGFDPHDFTHDVIVDGNEAYDNGSHGFIISRGCERFTFTNNISRDNKVKPGSKNPSAHGFMLDPGADPAKAGVPQAPSINNLFENNQAFGNDGYGMRIFGSNSNTLRSNTFNNNRTGITIENGSTGNTIENNIITNSVGEAGVDASGKPTIKGGYGVYAFQGADANTIVGNTITGNVNNGIYLKTGNNIVRDNTVANNQGDGIGTLQETDSELPPDPPEVSAVVDPALIASGFIEEQGPGAWSIAAVTLPNNNQIINNTVRSNADVGIALKGAANTLIEGNLVELNVGDGIYIAEGSVDTVVRQNTSQGNQGYGIKVNGATVLRTTLTLNSVMGNGSGGIAVTGGANGGITAPKLTITKAGTVNGLAAASAIIEIFSDQGKQGAFYETTIQASETGVFTFTPSLNFRGGFITATATDVAGNTSGFSNTVPGLNARYMIYMPVALKP